MRRRLLLLVLPLAFAAAPADASVKVGIADNKPDMFEDARFAALGVKHVRKSIAWDVLRDEERRARLDAWMAGARARGARVLLSFDRSHARPSYNPTPKELADALRALRTRYPGQVREIATWNEPNINKQPRLVAQWWLALRKACPSCTVLAGELVDAKNAGSYARRVAKFAKREPTAWGLHNYVDVNRFSKTGTTAFLKQTRGQVWLTETGGVQSRQNPKFAFRGTGPQHAANATRFLFRELVGLSPRIKRVYVYHWNSVEGPLTWDSGLVGPDGERPSLAVVREAMRGRIKPKRPAKRAVLEYKAPKAGGRGAKPRGRR
jgi:hypothetical protein